MFCRGSKASPTPKRRAVAGISCISPWAPFEDTARWSNSDSAWITALTRSVETPNAAAASKMCRSHSPLYGTRLKPREWISRPLPGYVRRKSLVEGTLVASITPLALTRV